MRYFSGFSFDESFGLLWRDGIRVPLTAKASAVLKCLTDAAGRTLTKRALLDLVWPNTHVAPDNIKVLVREIRLALGDDARSPRLIRTLPRDGYTFIAPVSKTVPSLEDAPGRIFTGRGSELEAVARLVDTSAGGARTLALIEGAPGVGKTALFEKALKAAAQKGFVVARGQCVPTSGPVEPYGPILDALQRLLTDVPRVRQIIAPYAPALMAHLRAPLLPGLGEGAADRAPSPRLLREIVAAFEALSANACVVLALDDVHWLDSASIDVVGALARRHHPARLAILATYRPLDAIAGAQPLQRLVDELEITRCAVVLPIGCLTRADVVQYALRRFGLSAVPAIAGVLEEASGGHPLLLATAAQAIDEQLGQAHDQLKTPGRIKALSVTAAQAVSAVMARQLDQLSPEERLLLLPLSSLGVEFSVWKAARVSRRSPASVEQTLERLASRGEVIARTSGKQGTQYRFTHALYLELLNGGTALSNAS